MTSKYYCNPSSGHHLKSLGVPSLLCLYTESNGFFLSKSQHNLVLLLFIQADDMFWPFLGHPQVTI